MGEIQTINTDKYGVLRVLQAYHEGPRPIFLLETGDYVYDSGLPVQEKAELRKAVPVHLLQAALDRFDKSLEREQNPARAIKVLGNNQVVFEDDGSPVTNIQDIVAFFDAGPFREAAMIAFADKLKAEKETKTPIVMPKRPMAKKSAAGKGKGGAAKKAAPPVQVTA